ncbi:hypothetical protein CA85_30500 [Allorhodopirellula solitaria]|uniref:Uncharacterized protein n=1 Tax=Allorhodopirellula solitaria TaxID=2527987 RepID=A0A5C5XSG0_9BACT|nr:hypothetical protein CA85_30500 [Allorhodopirellula solitaria]
MGAGATLHRSNHKTEIPARQADRGSGFVGNQQLARLDIYDIDHSLAPVRGRPHRTHLKITSQRYPLGLKNAERRALTEFATQ